MKHSEMHTWTLQYCKETLDSHKNFIALHDEIKLFKTHYPNAIVNADRMGYVTISYACKRTAEGAAKAFQHAVTRFDWWKEV